MNEASANSASRGPDGHAESTPDRRPATGGFIAAGLFLTIAAIGAYSLSNDPYLHMGATGSDPGPAFVPWITVYVLGIGSLVFLAIEAAKAYRAGGVAFMGEFTFARLWVPVVFVALLTLYVSVIPSLGFIGPSLAFALICISIFHWRTGDAFSPRYLVQIPVEAVLLTGAIYALFRYGINVPLP